MLDCSGMVQVGGGTDAGSQLLPWRGDDVGYLIIPHMLASEDMPM